MIPRPHQSVIDHLSQQGDDDLQRIADLVDSPGAAGHFDLAAKNLDEGHELDDVEWALAAHWVKRVARVRLELMVSTSGGFNRPTARWVVRKENPDGLFLSSSGQDVAKLEQEISETMGCEGIQLADVDKDAVFCPEAVLLCASSREMDGEMRAFLNEHPDIDVNLDHYVESHPEIDEWRPIHLATVASGMTEDAIHRLIDRGARVEVPGAKGVTALALSMDKPAKRAEIPLLEAGADPHAIIATGTSRIPVMVWALEQGEDRVVAALRHGFTFQNLVEKDMNHVLQVMIEEESIPAFQAAIEQGVDLSCIEKTWIEKALGSKNRDFRDFVRSWYDSRLMLAEEPRLKQGPENGQNTPAL